jgi:hypothetical protein
MTQDQFNALVKSAGLGGGSSPSQLQDAFKLYQQNPQSINAMIGGTYTPGGAGTYGAAGHGVQTMGGGQVIGGVPFQTMANLLQGYVPPQQQPQQQPQQPQQPQLSPAQPMPTVQTTPLKPTAQPAVTQAPTMNVPQANAATAQPLFSLGQGAGMQQPQLPQPQNPLIQQQQQPQWFQEGGQVQPMQQPQNQGFTLGNQSEANQTGWYNPMYQASALGAWALGGYPMVINQAPSGTPSDKSGVAAVGQPTVYNAPGYRAGTYPYQDATAQYSPITLPSGQTYSAQQVGAFSPADWAELAKVGVKQQQPYMQMPQMPSSIAGGPWATNPGVFVRAPMPTLNQPVGWAGSPTSPLTPTAQANAAQMPQQPITPAANAATATPTPLAQTAAPPAAAPPAPGINLGAHTSALANAGMAIYAHYGGDPNTASPADITNFHNQLLSHIGGSAPGATTPPATTAGRGAPAAPGPVKMQTGGVVPDYWNKRQPSEAVHRPINQSTQSSSSSPQSDSQGNTQDEGMSQGATQGSTGSSYPQWIQNAIQAKQASAYASAPNIGSLAGEQAYVTGEPVAGVGAAGVSGPGTGVPTLQAAGAISGLASGLSAAAQAYADSIKPWQMQPSHIPDPSQMPRYTPPTLSSMGT